MKHLTAENSNLALKVEVLAGQWMCVLSWTKYLWEDIYILIPFARLNAVIEGGLFVRFCFISGFHRDAGLDTWFSDGLAVLGSWLDSKILEVIPNLNNSMIFKVIEVICGSVKTLDPRHCQMEPSASSCFLLSLLLCLLSQISYSQRHWAPCSQDKYTFSLSDKALWTTTPPHLRVLINIVLLRGKPS